MAQKTYNKRLRRGNGRSTHAGSGGFYRSFNYRTTFLQNLLPARPILKVVSRTAKRIKLKASKKALKKPTNKVNFVKFLHTSARSHKQNFLFLRLKSKR